MKTFSARYKKYTNGGNTQEAMNEANLAGGLATGIGQAASLVGDVADTLGPANQYGKKSLGANLMGNAGRFASMGSAFGPWGAAAGAVVGAGIGAIANGKQKKEETRLKFYEDLNTFQQNQNNTRSRLLNDPTLVHGNLAANYYAAGGDLNVASQNLEGGVAKKLNSTSAEFVGPTHEGGGIQIPGAQAEVEGKETTNGSYVFSERLGFAQIHKPIAKAIGKIEQKAMSPERVNSLNLLRDKEHQLQLSQESLKQKLGLN